MGVVPRLNFRIAFGSSRGLPCAMPLRPLLAGLILPFSAIAAERPNIVLIMVDDMGYSDISPYGGEIDTPNLAALAKNGLRFTQFYNSACCCPTRASLLTGLHPHETGIGHMTTENSRAEDNAFIRDGDWKLVGRGVSPGDGLKEARWQLYHITEDGTELNNLAASHPEKVGELSSKWEAWAKRVQVFPKPRPN